MKDEKVKAFRFTVGMATCLYKELPSTHPFASHGHCVFSLSLSLSPHHEHEGCGLWLVRVSQRRIELAFVGNVGWLEAFIHDNQREREKQRVCKASDQASFPSKTHGEPGGDDDGGEFSCRAFWFVLSAFLASSHGERSKQTHLSLPLSMKRLDLPGKRFHAPF
ncbi:hypothetical protein BT93_F0502 [Corymbia citriodora subsp. variegata]|nr:hypothetical protein BT93_F0502 [Corymbia citriodora subsp. variegata]